MHELPIELACHQGWHTSNENKNENECPLSSHVSLPSVKLPNTHFVIILYMFCVFLHPTYAFPSSVCWQPCSLILSPRLKSWRMWLHTCFVLALWSRPLRVLKGPIQSRSIMAVVASWALFPSATAHICLKRTVKLCGSLSTRAICL